MIITGGENVYSSEVEVVLGEHDAIAEAVVIGVPDPHWGERVHAVVVAREGAVVDPEALQAFCRERLAGYKVPKGIEVRDAVPRLPTGKIAKAALRDEYWPAGSVRVRGA
jgi:acyl-CoA synthetase (AMP-forming)/AMP-acid ligase II